MPFAILFVIFVVLVLVVRASATNDRGGLLTRGVFAHGLVLRADSTATERTFGGQRFELRALTLDVEVPGEAPYVVSVTPMIPRICEVLPGSSLDLRVDRKNRQNIAIVGPAGASGWIAAGASIPGQTWAPQPSVASPRGCGMFVVVLVGMSLALAAVLSFVSGSESHEARPATHAAPPRPAHAPIPRPSPKAHPH